MAALASSTLLSSPALAVDFRPQAEIEGGFFSGGSGASGGFFLPFVLDSGNAIFIDTRGAIENDSVRQGSIGAGYRFLANDQWVIGAYGYYDYLKSSYGNSFSQLSIGLEALSGDLEMRSNFYLPLTGAKTLNAFNTAYVRDHVLVFQEGRERARAASMPKSATGCRCSRTTPRCTSRSLAAATGMADATSTTCSAPSCVRS